MWLAAQKGSFEWKSGIKGWIRTPEYVKALLKTDLTWLTFTAQQTIEREKMMKNIFTFSFCYSRGCETRVLRPSMSAIFCAWWRHQLKQESMMWKRDEMSFYDVISAISPRENVNKQQNTEKPEINDTKTVYEKNFLICLRTHLYTHVFIVHHLHFLLNDIIVDHNNSMTRVIWKFLNDFLRLPF